MENSNRFVIFGLIFLLIAHLGATHTLHREKRQMYSNSMVATGMMPGDDGSDRAIPGLSEIQTAIEVAQFLIRVGQQVVPVILENITPAP
ncbi:uncharacterized protein LOC119771235 [Culex quinquefasciatus]|uniref:uncharacterized protein LOC119771235 n=1 Tax=Culex quinquefasciatus TaxID=7176 RepID=UPI0018E39F7B|nr:uncharacterized protein LOC119771235 [Culex quinquefasciatus]